MITDKTGHRRLHYLSHAQFKTVAQVFEHIFKMPGYTAHKMNGMFPGFGVLVQMRGDEITQTIFYDIFYHVVAAVFAEKGCKRSQVTVWPWFFVYMLQYLPIMRIEF